MRSRACCEWSGPAALSSQTLRRSFIKVIQQLHEAPIKRHEINKHIDLQSTRIRRVPAGTISVNANLSWSIHQSADCQKKQTYTKIKEYKVILHNKSLIRSNRHVSAALVRWWKNQKVLNWNILSALFPFFVQNFLHYEDWILFISLLLSYIYYFHNITKSLNPTTWGPRASVVLVQINWEGFIRKSIWCQIFTHREDEMVRLTRACALCGADGWRK